MLLTGAAHARTGGAGWSAVLVAELFTAEEYSQKFNRRRHFDYGDRQRITRASVRGLVCTMDVTRDNDELLVFGTDVESGVAMRGHM
jgi:hypothetical protein